MEDEKAERESWRWWWQVMGQLVMGEC